MQVLHGTLFVGLQWRLPATLELGESHAVGDGKSREANRPAIV